MYNKGWDQNFTIFYSQNHFDALNMVECQGQWPGATLSAKMREDKNQQDRIRSQMDLLCGPDKSGLLADLHSSQKEMHL